MDMKPDLLSRIFIFFLALLFVPYFLYGQKLQTDLRIEKGDFILGYDSRGITGLANRRDPYQAELLAPGSRLDVVVRYRVAEGDWLMIYTGNRRLEARPEEGKIIYIDEEKGSPLKMTQQFSINERFLDWTFEIETTWNFSVLLGDVAISIPWRSPRGETGRNIFEKGWTKHHFIAGHGSFIYFVRASGEPPYLIITPHPGTKLEYYSSEMRGNYLAYIHSGYSGNLENRGTWRQPHTYLELGPAGGASSKGRYGFRFTWAWSYDELREILYREGLFDIRVVPGMSVPEDLKVLLALRTKANIESIEPEFPEKTALHRLPSVQAGVNLYELKFQRLGENKLTIHHDGDRKTILEFFVTEPVETLIKKRSWFITHRQQHRDPTKWYNGLFSVYDMKNKILRGPDNTDGFDYWWGYVVACDDPILGKAPFVASKNVHFPEPEEIAAVEYYLENYVWGKLQRTDEEKPYPYGIYGVPNWKVNRDPDPRARAGIRNRLLDRMPVWRAFDYPHMIMLYYHIYEIAKKYPQYSKYLDAHGYLERAYGTARAYFLYPYEILPEYEVYKVGCYNELIILDLIAALEKEGFEDKARWLRSEWEKKVKYFIYDDPYPYASEYPFDRTAFESTYALAKYGATHDLQPDENLWYDVNLKKWYSHPRVSREDARRFMERQLWANVAVRGWLETAYYLLGADFTGSSDVGCLTYMAQMGGWAILDYALHFAPDPFDWLQLGYASYLSAWSLMNTGRPETNYGYWSPGPENDGAAGWQFMAAKFGRAWIRKDMPRGAWYYDGEIDLGFGGALRTAITILTRDPLFGWFAYGGDLKISSKAFEIIPRDGLRKRLAIILKDFRLKLELDRDGLAAEKPVVIDRNLNKIKFLLENRTHDFHVTQLKITSFKPARYLISKDGKKVAEVKAGPQAEIELKMESPLTRVAIIKLD